MYRRLATVGILSLVFLSSSSSGARAERPLDASEAAIARPNVGVSPDQKDRTPGAAHTSGGQAVDGTERRVLVDLPLRGQYASDVFLPGLPEIGIFDPAVALEQIDETQLIQLVYDAYSRYSATSDGDRAEFTFHGFRTVYRDEFAKVAYYPDMVTLTRDWKLRAVMHTEYENDVPEGVQYQAEWILVDHLKYQGAAELLGESVLELIDVVAERFGSWRRTVALTSVDLTVEFSGRSERYRAGVLWLLEPDGTLKFDVVDNVVPEVPFAVSEKIAPLFGSPKENLRPFESVTEALGGDSSTCRQQTWPVRSSGQMTDYGSEEHKDGQHEAVFIGEFSCSCDSACASKCMPSILVKACQDRGELTNFNTVHQATPKTDTKQQSVQDGHMGGAGCAAGLGCAIQSCPAFSCAGVSIKVSGGVGGLTFSTSAPVIMMANLSHAHECGRCTEEIPPEEEPQENDKGDTSGEPVGDQPTPILVDLDRGGFRLTDLAGGVEFDVDADGAAERVSWTAAGSGDAWLALDRDGDGLVGDASELFGDHTPQPPATQPHGYLALAVFDQPAEGGDGDGWITAADAVFPALRLWTDRDHDGVSQPAELSTLAEGGVTAIDLRYVESRRTDRHGNRFRYSSRVRLDRGTTRSADVFLLSEEIE